MEDLPGRLHRQGARRSLILPAHVAAAKPQQYAARLTWFLRKREAQDTSPLLSLAKSLAFAQTCPRTWQLAWGSTLARLAAQAPPGRTRRPSLEGMQSLYPVVALCPRAARVPACVCDSTPPVAHYLGQAAKRVDAAHGARAASVSCSPETAPWCSALHSTRSRGVPSPPLLMRSPRRTRLALFYALTCCPPHAMPGAARI